MDIIDFHNFKLVRNPTPLQSEVITDGNDELEFGCLGEMSDVELLRILGDKVNELFTLLTKYNINSKELILYDTGNTCSK